MKYVAPTVVEEPMVAAPNAAQMKAAAMNKNKQSAMAGAQSLGIAQQQAQANAQQGASRFGALQSKSLGNVGATQNTPTVADPMGQIQNAYQNTLLGALDGTLFDPMASANNEALARAEANSRAKGATNIAQAGFAGTSLGQQAAQGTEQQLMQNRFDTNVQTEVARNKMRFDALNQARTALKDQEDSLKFQDDRRKTAQTDFASYAQSHLDLKNMTPEQIMTDQGAMSVGQGLWESFGGKGPAPAQWVKQQFDAVNDPRLNNAIAAKKYEIDEAVKAGALSAENGEIAKFLVESDLTGKLFLDITVDENGDIHFNGVNDLNGDSLTGVGSAPAKEGTNLGDHYFENGKVYKTGSDGKAAEVQFNYDDPFGNDADKYLEQLNKADQNDPTVKYWKEEVYRTRAEQIVDGTKEMDKIEDPALLQAVKDKLGGEWQPKLTYDSRGTFLPDERYIHNAPTVGSTFNYGGKTYRVTEGKKLVKSGQNHDQFKAVDLSTGETKIISVTGNKGRELKINVG